MDHEAEFPHPIESDGIYRGNRAEKQRVLVEKYENTAQNS
ncbi:hypothetical protein HMPREF3033_00638 [Veillonellaceae bacterium DNF00751]|nr:hypothetical protein HMPREF3033_00638 [Veillonellaceae bacterium DNF00751]